MNLFSNDILSRAKALFAELKQLEEEERIEVINGIKQELHQHSPFASEPVDCVLWVKSDQVEANGYNPNSVAPPEMRLLELSIDKDGYTQPIVTFDEGENYTVIDGYHRSRVGKESKKIRERVRGYLPVVVANDGRTEIKDRVAATIRHNRARGVHGVDPMMGIVSKLLQEGWKDSDVAKELGMDADEVLRFKQVSGLASLFENKEYSRAWE